MRRVDEDVLLMVAIHQIALGEYQTVTAMFETRHDTSRVFHSGDGCLSVRFQLHQIELERPICAFRFHGHSIAFHQLPVAVQFAIARKFVATAHHEEKGGEEENDSATEVSQTLLSTFWLEWLLMLSTIQTLLSI